MSLNKLAMFVSLHFPGSKSDLAVFRAMSDKHKISTLTQFGGNELSDKDFESYSWGILFEEEYVGVKASV